MKNFVLGFLLSTVMFVGYFGFCPHAKEMLVRPDPLNNHVNCDFVLRIIIDEENKVKDIQMPGDFILDNLED